MNKALTDLQLLKEAQKINRNSEYKMYREQILEILKKSFEESQEDYAAFLFAFASVANEIQRKQFKSKQT